MTAIAGIVAPNVVYADGLFNTTTGVDLSPITSSAFSPITITRTWIGYFKPVSTATVKLGLYTVANSGPYGADATTEGRLWFGATAISGFTNGNANITAINTQYSTSNISMTAGVYYPVRIRWDGTYDDGFFGNDSDGSITFYANDSTSVSGLVFYNTLTNGF
jgi:hypothetical protein